MNWHIPKDERSVYVTRSTRSVQGTTTKPVPSSDEVVEHHALSHECEGDVMEIWCPCKNAVLVFCDDCDQALFLIVRPGTWCEHARMAWADLS